jgi:hypothetical protein
LSSRIAGSPAYWRQKRHLIPLAHDGGPVAELVVARQNDAGGHLAHARELPHIPLEHSLKPLAFADLNALFRTADDVLQQPEKQHVHVHDVIVTDWSRRAWVSATYVQA